MTGQRQALVAIAGFALIAVALLFRAGDARPVRAVTNCETSTGDVSGVETLVLQLVNYHRQAEGRAALKASPALARAAAWKSEDAASTASHTDSLGRGPSARAMDCGYPGQIGENIAWGFGAFPGQSDLSRAQQVVDAWMASPGHRTNILTAYYRAGGVGFSGGRWTLDLGAAIDTGAYDVGSVDPSGATTTVPPATPTPPSATPTPPPPTPTAVPTPSSTPPIATVSLAQGMNLVTYAGPDQPASVALQSLHGTVVDVNRWNAATGTWERYLPGGPGWVNTFTTLRFGEAYFIRMSSPATWTY